MPGWNNPLPIGQSGWSIVRRWSEKGLSGQGKARYQWAREPLLVVHIGQSNPGGWRPRSSLQLALSSPSSLQIAFFVFPPTTPKSHIGPLLSLRNILVATILSDKGSDIPPTPPTVDLRKKWNRMKERIARIVFGFLISLYSLVFHSSSY